MMPEQMPLSPINTIYARRLIEWRLDEIVDDPYGYEDADWDDMDLFCRETFGEGIWDIVKKKYDQTTYNINRLKEVFKGARARP